MLNISPFTYGMVVQQVYDSGNVFPPSILDIEESSLLAYFTAAIQNVASVSLAANYPTIVSVKHSLVNAYKNLLAVSVETEYDFEGSEKVCSLSLVLSLDSPMTILISFIHSTLRSMRLKKYSNFLLRESQALFTLHKLLYGDMD
jgi:hypothetical protein